ncbi:MULTISPECIES: LppU/SCO3897 family protein [Kitasatospora]|uniref:Uncharacterized protein n=2 Tax=Kitasatospora TaxID=2063 RepID=A0ABT1J795_9ACTN|nr:hypothetical protein [Kitasatospora paracochleata]MCP2313305.1 hypothetical protein [Kitasatospora paracochleata]
MSTPPAAEDQATSPYPEIPVEAEPAKKKRNVARLVGKYVGIVVAGVIALMVWSWFHKDAPDMAQAGNCVTNAGTEAKPKVSIVDCGAANADFKVLKVVQSSNDQECESVEGLVASYVEKSSTSFTLCLGKNH